MKTENQEVIWQLLADEAEAQIKKYEDLLVRLNKSLKFFRKQAALGIKFPIGDIAVKKIEHDPSSNHR